MAHFFDLENTLCVETTKGTSNCPSLFTTGTEDNNIYQLDKKKKKNTHGRKKTK